jgi:hypothetical protein
VIGLYLNPPQQEMVICVDNKIQMLRLTALMTRDYEQQHDHAVRSVRVLKDRRTGSLGSA